MVSLAALVALDHSLPFVPVVLPSALLVDYLRQRRLENVWFLGAASALAVVLVNWLILQVLPSIKWQGDDLTFGLLGAMAAGGVAAAVGTRLGYALAGRSGASARSMFRRAAFVGAIALMLAPIPALAHEVGGDAGRGVISWVPAEVAPGARVSLRIEDLKATSGAEIERLRLEAWRAEHRIRIPLQQTEGAYEGRFTPPDEGAWMLLLWVEARDDSLLATQRLDVDGDAGLSSGVHRERFTLGFDTLAQSEPHVWLDLLAYAVAAAILMLLLRGLLRSLARLSSAQSSAVDV
jgi:hypothetical protein